MSTTTETQAVEQDCAFDMIGSHLAAYVACPFCHTANVFTFIESYASPVRVEERCAHLSARIFDDESGNNRFEFTRESAGTQDVP